MDNLNVDSASTVEELPFGHTGCPCLLVVDDDVIQRRIIAKLGRQAGHTVIEAGSVEEAQRLIKTERVNCVTVDLSLGDRSGVEVLLGLGAHSRNVPVLIISGMPEQVLQSTTSYAEQCGLFVHATFTKPLDLGRLRRSLSEVQRVSTVIGPLGS